MSSSSEHPIQQARREFRDGYRSYLGRTHDLMVELRDDQQPEAPDAELVADVYDVATDDLPELGTADVDFGAPLSEDEYRALEFGEEDGGALV